MRAFEDREGHKYTLRATYHDPKLDRPVTIERSCEPVECRGHGHECESAVCFGSGRVVVDPELATRVRRRRPAASKALVSRIAVIIVDVDGGLWDLREPPSPVHRQLLEAKASAKDVADYAQSFCDAWVQDHGEPPDRVELVRRRDETTLEPDPLVTHRCPPLKE